MANKIQIRRGLETNLPTLDVGEVAFTTDSYKFFIGTSGSNIEFRQASDFVDIAGDTMTGALTIDVNSATALVVEQSGVHDNVLVVDTANSRIGIGTASPDTNLNISKLATNSNYYAIYIDNTDPPSVSGEEDEAVSLAGRLADNAGNLYIAGAIKFGKDSDFRTDIKRDGHLSFSIRLNDVLEEKMRISSGGNVGIGTTNPSAKLDINSDVIRLRTSKTPASAGDSGNTGDIAWDSSYLYIAVGTNTWKRVALNSW